MMATIIALNLDIQLQGGKVLVLYIGSRSSRNTMHLLYCGLQINNNPDMQSLWCFITYWKFYWWFSNRKYSREYPNWYYLSGDTVIIFHLPKSLILVKSLYYTAHLQHREYLRISQTIEIVIPYSNADGQCFQSVALQLLHLPISTVWMVLVLQLLQILIHRHFFKEKNDLMQPWLHTLVLLMTLSRIGAVFDHSRLLCFLFEYYFSVVDIMIFISR